MASPRTKMQKKATITRITDTEARIERTFDAPRELVWRAHTDPALFTRWMGPRRLKIRLDEMDVRPGGKWRFVHIEDDGTEYGFHGEYLEVVKPERLSQTWLFEGLPDARSIEPLIETLTFTEKDGKTYLVANSKFQKKEHVDGYLASGMEEGMQETYERLDELLVEIA